MQAPPDRLIEYGCFGMGGGGEGGGAGGLWGEVVHLDSASRTPDTQASLLGQGQAQVHELIKGVAKCPTGRALHSALQLPRKYVLNDTVASAVGVVPCLIGLGGD